VTIGPFLFDGSVCLDPFLKGHIRVGPKRAGLTRLPPLLVSSYNILYNPYNKILQLSKPEKYKFIFFYWFSNRTKINNLDYQFSYSNLVLDDISKQLTG